MSHPVAPPSHHPVGRDVSALGCHHKRAVHDTISIGRLVHHLSQQAETILVNGDADFIFMGRELLRDPYFPLSAAKELRAEGPIPKQYERAF